MSAGAYEITVTHSIDAAHRVVGHEGGEGKCARLHGHTYVVTVMAQAEELDELGFVVDFGAVKAVLNEWDHRTLLWVEDHLVDDLLNHKGVVRLAFNPTAENMARHLAECLLGLRAELLAVRVVVRETAKTEAVWDAIR